MASLQLDLTEREAIGGQKFLSEKPLLFVVNLIRASFPLGATRKGGGVEYASRLDRPVIEACALIEAEISERSSRPAGVLG